MWRRCENSPVNDGHGQQDTGPATQGAHQIGAHTQGPNRGPTKGGGGGNDALQFLVDTTLGLTVPGDNQLLVLETLGDLPGAGAGDFDPGLGKEGADAEHKGDVDEGVNRIGKGLFNGVGWGHVVGHTGHGGQLGRIFHGL